MSTSTERPLTEPPVQEIALCQAQDQDGLLDCECDGDDERAFSQGSVTKLQKIREFVRNYAYSITYLFFLFLTAALVIAFARDVRGSHTPRYSFEPTTSEFLPKQSSDTTIEGPLEYIRSVILKYSEPKSFLRRNSPHSLVLQWLLYQADELEEPALTQRYASLLLLRSLRGREFKQYYNESAEKQPQNECEFEGFRCNEAGSVVEIVLPDRGLWGKIPNEVGLLSNLLTVDLSSNAIFGSIPETLWKNLTKLETLNLGRNELRGTISSSIEALSRLQHLRLANNKLSGSLPTQLKALSSLKTFEIGEGSIEGDIMEIVNFWKDLEVLSLVSNQVSGTFSPAFGELQNLKRLNMEDVLVSGQLPTEMTQLTNLSSITLGLARVTGTIPSTFQAFPNLEVLQIGGRGFSGTLSTTIGVASNLRTLQFVDSGIQGTIPTEIGLCTNLENLSFELSFFQGTLPTEIGLLSSLNYFVAIERKLEGNLPSGLCEGNTTVWFGCNLRCECCESQCIGI